MPIFRKFIRFYGPYQRIFYIDLVCAAVAALIDLAFPQILYFLTQNLFNRTAAEILAACPYILLGMLVLYGLRYACQYYITTWGHIMGARMESDMREQLFDQYQKLDFAYYDRNNTGVMMSKLVSDLFDISELAHHGPEHLFISLLTIFGAFALLLLLNVKMTLLLLAVVLGMLAFSWRQNKKLKGIFLDNRQKIAGVNASLQDSLAGIRVVKSFANEDLERAKFAKSNQAFLVSKESSYRAMGSFFAGNEFFFGILYTVVLVSGGYFIAEGTLSAADLAVYALYIGIFIRPIGVLINFTELFQRGYSGFRRFLEVVETEPAIKDTAGAVELGVVRGDIEYRGVSFRYGEEASVLEGVDIRIDAGRTVALVGPSGGGKTTICSLLPRFYEASSGQVLIDGHDVRNIRLDSLRRNIGVVQQDVYLFDGTIRDNIVYGKPAATEAEIEAAARQANIHEFICSLPDGYDSYVGERGTRLSAVRSSGWQSPGCS